jgi:hypothetical protein
MISSINTPVRWYADIFESERFSNDCDIERFELISDKTRLLPFQFRRPKSGEPIGGWFLRKECVNPAEEILDLRDSLFTYDTGYWSATRFTFINGKIRARGGALGSDLSKTGVFTLSKYYDITIVVNEFVKQVGSTFAVTYDIAGSGVVPITSTGTIKLKILATSADFAIYSIGGTANDRILIESISIMEYQIFDTGLGDIMLDSTLLTLINLDEDYDLIQYCGNVLPIQIPCGKYYIIMSWGETGICYSELITVKDFIPSRSPFTMIEWRNSCDLGDIIYQTIGGCQYTNRMYIDSELSKTEYPFKEEGEEDGNYKLNITFQKWEKTSNLIFPKCPEFIVDALTGIRLHDIVSITKSIRKNQQEVLPSFEVEKVEYENTSVFVDCATNVELKLLLKDNVVDSTCCTNVTLPACYECSYTVDDMDVLTDDIYFGTPSEELDFGLYQLVEGEYVLIPEADVVVCVNSTDLKYINTNGEFWQIVPNVGNVTELPGATTIYNVFGYIYPNSYARIRAVIYDADTAITTTVNYPTIYDQDNLTAGVEILSSSFGVSVPTNGAVSFFIENFTLTCNYGFSQGFDTFYPTLNAVVNTWRNKFVIKPSVQTIVAINAFIQGLDDDGILGEFDLLHVLAGLDSAEYRLTPLISTSGVNFTANGSYTFNSSGFKGNGTTGYMNLRWRADVHGVKYLVNDACMGVYINDNVQEDTYDIATKTGTYNSGIRSRTLLDTAIGTLNNNLGLTGANTSSIGLFSIAFDGTTRTLYKNGSSLSSHVSASLGVSSYALYLGARNNDGVTDGFTNRTYQFVFVGSKLVDHSIVTSRFATLKTALGF